MEHKFDTPELKVFFIDTLTHLFEGRKNGIDKANLLEVTEKIIASPFSADEKVWLGVKIGIGISTIKTIPLEKS